MIRYRMCRALAYPDASRRFREQSQWACFFFRALRVPCPYNCGSAAIELSALTTHQRCQCQKRRVECPNVSCNVKLP